MRGVVKILVLSVFAVMTAIIGNAQNANQFREKLAQPDTLSGAVVRVFEHGAAAAAVNSDVSMQKDVVTGYRIRIFFNNSQNARQDAMAVQASFDKQFPEIKSYLSYENPAFIVTVGNCLTMEEALILQNKVKKKFNTAFVWRGEIPLEEFITKPEPKPEEEEIEE